MFGDVWRMVGAAATAALILATGCTGDDPVDPVDPAFEVVFVQDEQYFPLQDDAMCPVIYGAQGGWWVMPVLRVDGLGESPIVGCTMIDLDQDLELGSTIGMRRFVLGDSGWLEHTFLLYMEAVNTAEEFLALDGHRASFSCSASDGGSVELTQEAIVTIRSIQ